MLPSMDEGDSGGDAEVMAQNIRRLRKERGWSQTKLAEAMNERFHADGFQDQDWYQNTVSRIEAGRQRVNGREGKLLIELLGNVLVGTQSAERFAETAKTFTDHAVRQQVRDAREALKTAADKLDWLAESLGIED